MNDVACVQFLQWALPRLRLRWPGFRKVRRQVCKRLRRRLRELRLADLEAYRRHLQQQPAEWEVLGRLCRITISRFYRDRAVFEYLGREILPVLARAASARGDPALRCWSAGCASGEEAYSLVLVWRLVVQPRYPALAADILATDLDAALLKRAEQGCYPSGSLKEVPESWLAQAFDRQGNRYCLRPTFRSGVRFLEQDIRQTLPDGDFSLVLCRNLAFTYFEPEWQHEVLAGIHACLRRGGALVIGAHERLPDGSAGFVPWAPSLPVFRSV